MRRRTDVRRSAPVGAALAGALVLATAPLAPQSTSRRLDVQYGVWERADGGAAASYALRSTRPLLGPVQHGFGLHVFVDDHLGRRRAFYGAGYELAAFRARRGFAVYPVAGVAAGLSTDSSSDRLAALWRLGGGAEWRPFGPFALGIEGAYVVEDRGPRGFWRLHERREGWRAVLGMTIHWGTTGGGGGNDGRARPAPRPPERIEGPAAAVARTALEALGTPYTWGGTSDNGFDCSGLIQYAYARHGVTLPRRGADQAREGEPIPPVHDALAPGDILLFAERPGAGVTHVGMYVGDSLFIHSASDGVRLSYLTEDDPDGHYWVPRWVGARRMMR